MSTDTGRENRRGARRPRSATAPRWPTQIERRWQDRWERRARSTRPTPASRAGAEREKVYLLDMFPYPSGAGLHVGHPLGFIGTDVLGRYLRMTGHNVLHAMGFDAFGLPAEQYAVQTGTHPRTTTEANIAALQGAAAPAGPGPRRAPLGRDHRRRLLPLDPVDLPADLQLLVRRGAAPRPADRRAGGGVRRGRPADPGRPAVARADRGRAARRDRLVPAGLRLRGAGQLVPRAGHGAGQRGGHRRRAQRARATSPCSAAT